MNLTQGIFTERRRVRILWCALCVAIAGCDLPGKPNPDERPILPSEVSSFDTLYSTHCAGCHGATGEFGPAPPLNDPLFVKLIPEDDLKNVIRRGRPGTPMPPFLQKHGGSLTEKQIEILASGIESKWGTQESPQSASDPLPAYTATSRTSEKLSPEQLQRCRQLFADACGGCHGENGESADDAINVPAFLALISDQAVRRIIITGRADLGMPDYAATDGRSSDFKPLTSDEIDDLVSLIAHWRKHGPGAGDQHTTLSRLDTR